MTRSQDDHIRFSLRSWEYPVFPHVQQDRKEYSRPKTSRGRQMKKIAIELNVAATVSMQYMTEDKLT